MISDSIVAHKILLASILAMAASEASAKPISVISIGNIPVYSLTPSIQWIETLPANSRMCIESEPMTFKGGRFLQLLLEGQKVYTPLPVNRKIFAPDPAGDKSCMSQAASTALPASIPPAVQRAPQPAPNYVSPPTMAASGEAWTQTTNDVTSRDGPTTRLYAGKVAAARVPYYKADDSLIVGTTPPLGYFIDPQINPQLVCVMSTVVVHGEKFLEIVMRGNVHVYAPYGEENFAPWPGMDKYCVAPVQQHPLAEKDNRTSVASAQSPEQPPSEANQAKSNVGATGTDAGALEAGLAAEKRGDWKAAFWLLKPLADQGNPSAEAGIGYIFDNNDWPLKDNTEAMKWFRKAADQGNADAQNDLGAMYYNGEGVPKDNTEAMKWFRKAADQGNAVAQNSLGAMYHNGEGVSQDYAEAMKWYRKAADQGNTDAQENLASLNKQVEQDKINEPKLAARKEIGDTVCYPSRCTDSYCVPYGQVENVHNDKIEVRVHVPGSGYIGPYGGTVSAAHDELNWISYNEVIECGR